MVSLLRYTVQDICASTTVNSFSGSSLYHQLTSVFLKNMLPTSLSLALLLMNLCFIQPHVTLLQFGDIMDILRHQQFPLLGW
jgi:hypothetical protein